MSKRIILLSDGTGNSAAKVWRTNVWRTFESIDLTAPDQVAIYDDGVGTSSFKPAAMLGGAFGFGLKRNVLSLYKFLCRNYKSKADYQRAGIISEDDDIFAFGFSRGAFTIRMLIGLVLEQGLVDFKSEAQLDQKAKAAYRAYRENFKTKTRIEVPLRKLRNLFVSGTHDRTERPVDRIRFLGLWDTVAAYGLPVDEMTYGISHYIWPLELPSRRPNTARLRRACHALSLDDERTTFHPVLWDESELWKNGDLPVKPNAAGDRLTTNEKISQVWFAGVHANVGGGYPDDSLAHVSLNWMLEQAAACNLRLKTNPPAEPDALTSLWSRQDPDGRLYDSRSGLGGYYRYGPRSVADLSNSELYIDASNRVSIPVAKIHESVFSRMRANAHIYAPISLPDNYEIVTSGSKIVAPDTIKLAPNARPKYETSASAKQRYQEQEEIVWSYVWRRRIIYFLTVIASVHLAIYPLVSALPASGELTTRLRFVSDLIRLVAAFLPAKLDRWIDAYARDPLWFLVSAGTVAGLLWASTQLKTRITDKMEASWDQSLARQPRVAPAAGGAPAGSSLGILQGMAFVVVTAIALCFPLLPFAEGIKDTLPSVYSLVKNLGDGFIFFLAVTSLLTLGLRTKWVSKFRVKPGYKRGIQYIKRRLAPGVFAFLFAVYGLAFANHYIVNILDGFGFYCPSDRPHEISITDPPTIVDFDTSKVCKSLKITVEQNKKYKLVVEQVGNWEFNEAPSSTAGMPLAWFLASKPKPRPGEDEESKLWTYARAVQMFLMYPFKRTLDRPWGHVIVRYGSTGNEEDLIDPGNIKPTDENAKKKREETLEPKRDGELFIYLNKPVLAFWPEAFDNFNSGKARVTVTQVKKEK